MMSSCLSIFCLGFLLRICFYNTTCLTTFFCEPCIITSRIYGYCLILMRITSYMLHIQSFHEICTPHEFLVVITSTTFNGCSLELIVHITTIVICLLCLILINITIICRNIYIQVALRINR